VNDHASDASDQDRAGGGENQALKSLRPAAAL
jgi:hypothetical protein